MDRLDAMRAFTRIVERRSFTLAAEDLGLPRSTLTDVVKALETRLGVRLLNRTTRTVSPTLDGEAYHNRCLGILAEVEDAEGAFTGAVPRGLLRVDLQGTLARRFLLPELPAFRARYPEIQIHIGEGDRLVDLVREGVDCVVRAGEPRDSGLVGRRVALLEEGTWASPAYLLHHGVPEHPDALDGHKMVGIQNTARHGLFPLEFQMETGVKEVVLPCDVSVTGAESFVLLARLGFGMIQTPRYHVADALAAGDLVPVLTAWPPTPTPISVLYPENRQLSPRVRVFIDWVAATLREVC